MPAFARFVVFRAGMAVLSLLIVSFLVYSLMELVPGNCAIRYLSYKMTQGQIITDAEIHAEEVAMGLDKPFFERWTGWMGDVVFHGDFGESCMLQKSVNKMIGEKFVLSLILSVTALLITYAIAVPVGILSARSRGGRLDSSLRIFSYLGLALPDFLIALCIMLCSTLWFGDTLSGMFSPEFRDAPWSMAKILNMLSHMWVPVFLLAWSATAIQLQTVRAVMSDEQDKLYVTAAIARGVTGSRLTWRYPARHAMGPVINSIGFDLNRIFSGLPILATVLSLTEAGSLLLTSLSTSNDQQVAGAIIFLLTATIIALNFLTDILLALLDPRVRRGMF